MSKVDHPGLLYFPKEKRKTGLACINFNLDDQKDCTKRFEYRMGLDELTYSKIDVMIWDRDNSNGFGKTFRSVKQALIFINSHKEVNK